MEYTYQNWLKGNFDYNHLFDENDVCRVTKNELEKVNKKQEELFWNQVELKTKQRKEIINELLANSSKKTSFIKSSYSNLETLFYRPLSDQSIVAEFPEFKIKGKLQIVETEYVEYSGLIKIPKKYFVYFQQIYRRYINLGLCYFECISNPLQIEENVEVQIHTNAHVLHNIYEYLKGLKRGVKSSIKTRVKFEGYQSYKFYVTKNSDEKQKKLFDFLINEKYIYYETKFEKFKKAFSGELLNEHLNIIWLKSNVAFGVFIGLLIYYNYIDGMNYNSIAINNNLFCLEKNGVTKPLSKIKEGKNSVKLLDQDLDSKYSKLQEKISSL